MLTLIALGLLMGGRDMLNIWRKVACLDQRQREAIGLSVRHKESGLLKMPGYDAVNNLFHLLEPAGYARSTVAVRRDWQHKSAPEAQEKSHVRNFQSSLARAESQRIPAAVRGHWSVENLNHYKRDTCLWREDDHQHRRVNIAQNFALTRNALPALIPSSADEPLSGWFEIYQRKPATAIHLILQAATVS